VSLASGTRIGAYEILSLLGVGGMGEVYRARDTRLGRDVAIKVLPESLAADPDRIARFEREARTLASLNHPHIAQIHGLEDANGVKALVMELVEGPTLAEHLAARTLSGPRGLPLDEALPIAKQIAEALEAAHEQGIIHRDLKPANIKVRPDGTVKVLDFGLAKAMEPAPGSSPSMSMSPTITTPAHLRQGYGGQAMTQAGMILGTAAYMSPEQARGATVDKRADLWAFGVVLWEMLTGTRLFEGATVSDTLAAVLKTEPVWTALAPATPGFGRGRATGDRGSVGRSAGRAVGFRGCRRAGAGSRVRRTVVGLDGRTRRRRYRRRASRSSRPPTPTPCRLPSRPMAGRSSSWPPATAPRASGCGRWPQPRRGRLQEPTGLLIRSGRPTAGPWGSPPRAN